MDRLLSRLSCINSLSRKVDYHDAVLLYDSHQHEHTDEGIQRRLLPKDKQSKQPTNQRRGQRRQYCQRMQITLVQYREDYVHHEDCQGHQDRQTGDSVAKRLSFTLEFSTHCGWYHFRRCLADKVRCVAKGHTRLQIEK